VSGVEEVSQQLQRACPSFFREDDRAFYHASAKLKVGQGVCERPVSSDERLLHCIVKR
jgi:hypothetical protein